MFSKILVYLVCHDCQLLKFCKVGQVLDDAEQERSKHREPQDLFRVQLENIGEECVCAQPGRVFHMRRIRVCAARPQPKGLQVHASRDDLTR